MQADRPIWNTAGLQVVVRTEDDQAIELARRIGAGGQGEVWEASGGRVAVKLLHSRDQRAAERLATQLRNLRLLDLGDLPIARPLALLRPPHLGYTMVMLTDMVALRHLFAPTGRTALVPWYTETGGLRRRLRLLGRTASALAGLHGRGLCYGDPSPVNVMVSEPLDYEQVYLIDVDNVAVTSEVRGSAYATRGYAAPEVLVGRLGVSSLSDAYAFAVMAFELLTVVHPFVGDKVYDGEPDLEDKAFSGELPWIEHSTEASNRSRFGLARDVVLTPGLRALAARAFEAGAADPTARPTVAEWRTKLYEAADLTLACPECHGTYFGSRTTCPWCGVAPPPALFAQLLTQVGLEAAGKPMFAETRRALLVQRQVVTPVSARTAVAAVDESERPVVDLWYDHNDQLTVTNRWDRPTWLVGVGGAPRMAIAVGHDATIPMFNRRSGWELHLGPAHEPHRVLRFSRFVRKDNR